MKKNRYNSMNFIFIFFLSITIFFAGQHKCLAENVAATVEGIDWQYGPSVAELDKWAEIKVPVEYVYANGDDTKKLMEKMGNQPSDTMVGFLAPESLEWFAVFEFEETGYIKDDEKDDLDSDAILNTIRKGTEEGNKVRIEKGFTALHIVGWEIQPQYNEVTHNLEWAIRAKDDEENIILNHNTRLLGRKGVMKATLVVAPQYFSEVFPLYSTCLNDFDFKSGMKYAEYIKGDKIAKYGLTALVAGGAGVAAAKLGIFKILAKFGKVILLALVAIFVGFKNKIIGLFKGRSKDDTFRPDESTRDMNE